MCYLQSLAHSASSSTSKNTLIMFPSFARQVLKGKILPKKIKSLPIFLCLVFTVQFSEDVDIHYESYQKSLYSPFNLVPPTWWLYTAENWNPITSHYVGILIKHDQLNTIMTLRKHWLDFQNEEIGFSLKEAFLRPPAKHSPGVEQRQRGGPDHA